MIKSETPLVSIITINFNSLKYTLELLKSLSLVEYPSLEIIVVDNGSIEDPTQSILDQFSEVIVMRSARNLGFAGGNNLGFSKSTGDYLFYINNDTEVPNGLIETLLGNLMGRSNVGAISPKIIYFDTEIIQYAGYTDLSVTGRNKAIGNKQDSENFQELIETPFAHGAAMMVPRRVIEKVGLMPEIYFLYYEEMDWCEMMKRAGYTIYVDQSAIIYHKESMSIGKLNPLKSYYLFRNRILFARRNFGFFPLFFFIMYMSFIALPKQVLSDLYGKKNEHIKSVLKGYLWHFSNSIKDKKGE